MVPPRIDLVKWDDWRNAGGVASVVLMFAVDVLALGVHVYPRLLSAAFVTLVLGGAVLCVLGLAVSSYVKRTESAPVAANLTLFPLLFVSGSSSRWTANPSGCRGSRASSGQPSDPGLRLMLQPAHAWQRLRGPDLAALTVWGVVGALIAVSRFTIETTDGEEVCGRRPF